MTIKERLKEVMKDLDPSMQLRELEKLAMEIRKGNSIRIAGEVTKTRNKYPKLK